MIGEVRHPVLADWARLDGLRPPADLPRDEELSAVARARRLFPEFLLSPVSARPFERLQFLRATEELLIDLASDTPELDQHDRDRACVLPASCRPLVRVRLRRHISDGRLGLQHRVAGFTNPLAGALQAALPGLLRADPPGRQESVFPFRWQHHRQRVLPFGSPDDVRAAVRRVRAALDRGRGGVIAQCEWGKDNSAENIAAVFEAWDG